MLKDTGHGRLVSFSKSELIIDHRTEQQITVKPFEDFVHNFIIDDAKDKKQCRIAREGKSSSGTNHLALVIRGIFTRLFAPACRAWL